MNTFFRRDSLFTGKVDGRRVHVHREMVWLEQLLFLHHTGQTLKFSKVASKSYPKNFFNVSNPFFKNQTTQTS